MSNIQITENASGKYSPEWFYSESQTPEWISFAHKADELRENFINLFGIERLKSLSGKDLLTSLFYNDEGTKTNLCYILEMDKDIREVFGSISGGAAYKFGLFYHKKNQSWTCGSPLKPVLLTEAEAIQKAIKNMIYRKCCIFYTKIIISYQYSINQIIPRYMPEILFFICPYNCIFLIVC